MRVRFVPLICVYVCLFVLVGTPQGLADEGDPVIDEDGDIIVQVNGKPAQGQISDDMPTILFEAKQSTKHRVENTAMWTAPTLMVLCDSEGEELGRNLKDDDIDSFVEAELKQGTIYFLVLVAIQDEDKGKAFSILVTASKPEAAPVIPVVASGEKAETETLTGPVTLPSGVIVGQKDVIYSVKRDEQGRIIRLDDAQADGYLIEYRRADETPGLDVWRKDGTYTFYDFHDSYNTVSQGRFGEKPDTVMTFNRETGEQITQMVDGTQVTASPDAKGGMLVTTQIPGRAAIQSQVEAAGQTQGASRVVMDDQGRPKDVYLAGRKLTSTQYDAQGRVAEVTLDGGATIRHTYDDQGRLTQTKDVFGHVVRYEYDPAKRQVKTILPDQTSLLETQDAQGHVIETVGPGDKKVVTNYVDNVPVDVNLIGLDDQAYVPFDEGALSIARSSLTGTWVFNKATGQRIERRDPLGQSVTFVYDGQGQIKAVEDVNGTLVSYEYDTDRNLTQAKTPKNTVTLAYDETGRIVSERVEPAKMTVTYAYDEQGILTGLKDSKGNHVTYVRDENGQVSEIRDSQAGTIKLAYGVFALPAKLERPNGVITQWQYDAGGRLKQCSHQLAQETRTISYAYDVCSRLTGITREPGDDTAYTYDAAGHWTKIEECGESLETKYDVWGQILKHRNLVFNYDSAGHLNQLAMPGTEVRIAITCDKSGRMVECDMMGSPITYQYDWDHRLTGLQSTSTEETFVWMYDGLGRVVGHDVSNKEGQTHLKFVYALGQLYGVLDSDKGLDRYVMIPGTNCCVAVVKSDGTVLYSMWDHHHSIVGLTNADGVMTGTCEYWSVGGPKTEEDMPIAIAYEGGLSFVGHTVNVKDGRARLLAFHRDAAALAPWPYQSSLRTNSPFMSPTIEKTR